MEADHCAPALRCRRVVRGLILFALFLIAAAAAVAFGDGAAEAGAAAGAVRPGRMAPDERGSAYCVLDGVPVKLDFYRPAGTSGPAPAVIYIHGGGWVQGNRASGSGLLDAPALLDAGFAVFSIDYRLAPGHTFPAMIHDVKCAIRSIRAQAGHYGIDPDRIGVYGTSAGAHLAALAGVAGADAGFEVGPHLDQPSSVQAVVALFGPMDLPALLRADRNRARRAVFGDFDLERASPISYVSAGDPPFLLIHGDADALVPLEQSTRMHGALKAAGVESTLIVVRNGPHGLLSPRQRPSRAEITDAIVGFFKEHLLKRPGAGP